MAIAELDEWLPDCWIEFQPQHAWTIDRIRGKEREARAKRRRQKRGRLQPRLIERSS